MSKEKTFENALEAFKKENQDHKHLEDSVESLKMWKKDTGRHVGDLFNKNAGLKFDEFVKNLSEEIKPEFFVAYINSNKIKVLDKIPFTWSSVTLKKVIPILWKNRNTKDVATNILMEISGTSIQETVENYKKDFAQDKPLDEARIFRDSATKEIYDGLRLQALGEYMAEEYEKNPEKFKGLAESINETYGLSSSLKERLLKDFKKNAAEFIESAKYKTDQCRTLYETLSFYDEFYSKERTNFENLLVEELFKSNTFFERRFFQDKEKISGIKNNFKEVYEKNGLIKRAALEGFALQDETSLRNDDPLVRKYGHRSEPILQFLKIAAAAEYLAKKYEAASPAEKDKLINIFPLRQQYLLKEHLEQGNPAYTFNDRLIDLSSQNKNLDSVEKSLNFLKEGEIDKFLSNSHHYKFDAKIIKADNYGKVQRCASLLRGGYSNSAEMPRVFLEFIESIDQKKHNSKTENSIHAILSGAKPKILALLDQKLKKTQIDPWIKKIVNRYFERSLNDPKIKQSKKPLPKIKEPEPLTHILGATFPSFNALISRKPILKANKIIGGIEKDFVDIEDFKKSLKSAIGEEKKPDYIYLAIDAHGSNTLKEKSDYSLGLTQTHSLPVKDFFQAISDVSKEVPVALNMESCYGENVDAYMSILPKKSVVFTYGDKEFEVLFQDNVINSLEASYDVLSKKSDLPEPVKVFIGGILQNAGDVNTPKIHYVNSGGKVGLFDPDQKILEIAKNPDKYKESIMEAAKIAGFKKERREEIFYWSKDRLNNIENPGEKNFLKTELLKEPANKEDLKDFKKNFFFGDKESEKRFDMTSVHGKKNYKQEIIGATQESADKVLNIHTLLMVAATLEECKENAKNPEHFTSLFHGRLMNL